VAVAFFALWCTAEVGRYQQFGVAAPLGLVALSGALAFSRLKPVVSLALIALLLALQCAGIVPPPTATSWPVYFAALVPAFGSAYYASKTVARAALALGLPFSIAFGYASALGDRWNGADRLAGYTDPVLPVALVSLCVYAGAWAAGFALRANLAALRTQSQLRTTAAQLGETELELAMARERDRIARDVHDVLAHSLAVVVAQADGARFIGATKPEKTDAALIAIAEAARAALIDVRTLVEGVREQAGDRPQPTLDDLEPLLAQLAGAGMAIESQHFGERKELTPAQQLAVFRIVQESLTNALRHSGRSAPTRLAFDWRGPGLAVTVTSAADDDGTADTTVAEDDTAAPSGHGIRGMKDRARLAGGWLTAGASAPEREFVVAAFIPAGDEGLAA